jgi:phospholipid-binding lipoprotein MlaA
MFSEEESNVRGRDAGAGFGTTMLLAVALSVVLSGCGSMSGRLKSDVGLTAAGMSGPSVTEPTPVEPATVAATETVTPGVDVEMVTPSVDAEIGEPVTTEQVMDTAAEVEVSPTLLALADQGALTLIEQSIPELYASAFAQRVQDPSDAVDEEYDPWEPFNEKMFEFNRQLDRWILKPVARAYMVVMPEPFQVLIANGFDNINFVPRMVNSLLQGKWGGAGRELSRFLINSTAGIGGLFDPAKDFWGIHKSREDFGQTLGVWGSGPGPYLVLPFMEPLTVRDGIGKFVDGFMDPLSYLLPFVWDRLAMKVGDTVNDRALNYDLFQGFEESVIDMYSAVRHGYLQRRQQLIRE